MQKSDTIGEIAKALNTFQGKMSAVKKDGNNPFFHSRYATLDAIWEHIRKPLTESGLSVTQTLSTLDGNVLETTLMHSSGEWINGGMILNPVKDDPQGQGSAITYARRYGLSAILGIVADEDDDGNAATHTKKKGEPEPSPKPTEERITLKKAEDGKSIINLQMLADKAKEKDYKPELVKAFINKTYHVIARDLTQEQRRELFDGMEQDKYAGDMKGITEPEIDQEDIPF